jgi:hypothetical protein
MVDSPLLDNHKTKTTMDENTEENVPLVDKAEFFEDESSEDDFGKE